MNLLEIMMELSIISLISLKSNITCFSHKYPKIKIISDDNLPLEKTLTLHNLAILIKSVLKKKNQNHYYYNVFLEKCSYQLAKN